MKKMKKVPSYHNPLALAEASATAAWEVAATAAAASCSDGAAAVDGVAEGEDSSTWDRAGGGVVGGVAGGVAGGALVPTAVRMKSNYRADELHMGAEDMLPLMAYVLLNSGMSHPVSELRFIEV